MSKVHASDLDCEARNPIVLDEAPAPHSAAVSRLPGRPHALQLNSRAAAIGAVMAIKDQLIIDPNRDNATISLLMGIPHWLTRLVIIQHLAGNHGYPTTTSIRRTIDELQSRLPASGQPRGLNIDD